jgi:hypothetical protein
MQVLHHYNDRPLFAGLCPESLGIWSAHSYKWIIHRISLCIPRAFCALFLLNSEDRPQWNQCPWAFQHRVFCSLSRFSSILSLN